MTPSYKDEPLFNLGCDYVNEMFSLLATAESYLMKAKRGSIWAFTVSDEALSDAIKAARQKKHIITIRERFLDPQSPHRYKSQEQSEAIEKEIDRAPLRVQRLDELAAILNMTESLSEFKDAVNEMDKIIRGDNWPDTFPAIHLSHDLTTLIPRGASVPVSNAPPIK
jgi:monomeric isocitrate dehydrogenase